MKIVFMGTPSFAVPSLAALLDAGHDVAAVFTQPDRPAGRGHALRPPAVKRFALERGLRIEQPGKLREPAVLGRLREIAPDLIVVAAYGKILPKTLLEFPPHGAINVHASILPKYRGAAPIQRCLLAGDTVTGVTIMRMNERMDEGDVLLAREEPIHPDDTSVSLAERLSVLGASALVGALDRLARGELRPVPQRDEEATLAPMVRKEEGEIDWRRSAVEVERAVRAFHPWPAAWTRLHGKLLKILRATVAPREAGSPGEVLEADSGGIRIACGEGSLCALELQLEGKRPMPARDLVSGRLIRPGDHLGTGTQHPS